jgi:hypothetical protein
MKPIPGHEGYFVTSEGEVFSLKSGEMQQLVTQRNRDGYAIIVLYVNGKQKTFYVHHLVLLTFYGPPQEGQECRHLNSKKWDNHVDNPRWGTSTENSLDRQIHGTTARGTRNGRASQLVDSDIIKIRELYYDGYSAKAIGTLFKVTDVVVQQIGRGLTWKHIGGPIHNPKIRNRQYRSTPIPSHIQSQVEKKD